MIFRGIGVICVYLRFIIQKMKTTTGKLGRRQSNGRRFRVLGLAIATALLVIFTQLQRVVAQRGSVEQMMHNYRIMSRVTTRRLPLHPTP
jgi:hypothetical protein